ncbi:hypothetical protein MNV49_001219 [Pseudohyphozyma bogoriensis]|nr:hypothetical protein MNV49_001219 [Pseudohyphozyma bogoriensis]
MCAQRKTKNRCSGETPCERCKRLSKTCEYDRPDFVGDPTSARVGQLEAEMGAMRRGLEFTVSTLKALGHLPAAWDPFAGVGGTPKSEGGGGGGSEAEREPKRRKVSELDVGTSVSGSTLLENGLAEAFNAHTRGPPLPNYPAPQHPLDNYRFQLFHSPTQNSGIDLPTTAMQSEFEALTSTSKTNAPPAPPHAFKQPSYNRQPPPPNAFPDAVTKGLITEAEARMLFSYYMEHCHPFFPVLDKATDTYEVVRTESRSSTGAGPATALLNTLSEEAHGIARSSLFSIVTKTRAVQAMAILSVFSINGFLPSSHALSMGVEFNLHVPLRTLSLPKSSRLTSNIEDDEPSLVAGARTWLHLLVLQHSSCRGTGRALRVVDEESISGDALMALVRHPMANAYDVSLAAQVELMTVQSHAISSLSLVKKGMNISRHSMVTIRKYCEEVHTLFAKWMGELRTFVQDDSFISQLLTRHFKQAELEIIVSGMNGFAILHSLTDPSMRELSLSARTLASECLSIIVSPGPMLRDIAETDYFSRIVWSASSQLLTHTANTSPSGIGQQAHPLDLLASAVNDGLSYQAPMNDDPLNLQDWLAVDNPSFELDWTQLMSMSEPLDLSMAWETPLR